MTASRSHVRVAMPSGTVDSEPGRAFIQERLGVFAFWNALLSFGFLVLRVAAEVRLNPAFRPGILVGGSSAGDVTRRGADERSGSRDGDRGPHGKGGPLTIDE